jgi:hypothetical protein
MYILIFETRAGFNSIEFSNQLDMVDFLDRRKNDILSWSFSYKQSERKRL